MGRTEHGSSHTTQLLLLRKQYDQKMKRLIGVLSKQRQMMVKVEQQISSLQGVTIIDYDFSERFDALVGAKRQLLES